MKFGQTLGHVFSSHLSSFLIFCLFLHSLVLVVNGEDEQQDGLHREVRSAAMTFGKRLQNNLVAELGKRPKQLYSFGIGKRSISPKEMEEFMAETHANSKRSSDDSIGASSFEQEGENHEFSSDKRDPYAFGLGKRDPYAFGLGKRDPYAFGLGKRDPYAFGLGKRDPYAFGLGKRDPYAFGLGKRDPYAFGLGKRDPYAFGLGKRDPYAFGLGKRDPYAFGLGKRMPYSMGLGR